MPFAVAQWPHRPDPRSTAFAINGWNVGQVPPFSWTLATTGATGIWSFLNGGVLLRNTFASMSFSNYAPIIPPPFFITIQLTIDGFQIPQAGPPVHTIDQILALGVETSAAFTGRQRLLFPVAIAVQGPITMVEDSPSDGTIPNPVTLTPAIWSAE